jgi:hypothetical protein
LSPAWHVSGGSCLAWGRVLGWGGVGLMNGMYSELLNTSVWVWCHHQGILSMRVSRCWYCLGKCGRKMA